MRPGGQIAAAAAVEGRGRVSGAQKVGAALRQAREEKGLSLEDVAGAVRSPVRHVCALEEGRVDDLPPHPFARGLVVACASRLGLDGEAAVVEWGRPADDDETGRRSLFRVPIRRTPAGATGRCRWRVLLASWSRSWPARFSGLRLSRCRRIGRRRERRSPRRLRPKPRPPVPRLRPPIPRRAMLP